MNISEKYYSIKSELIILIVFALSYAAPFNKMHLVLISAFLIWNFVFYNRLKRISGSHSNLISLIPVFVCILFVPPAVLAAFSDDGSYTSFKFSLEVISGEKVNKILLLVILGMQSFSLGIGGDRRVIKEDSVLKFNPLLRLILMSLVVVGFVASLALRIQQIGFVSDEGFSAVYTEGVPGNIYLTILTYVFYAAIPVAYVSENKSNVQRILIAMLLTESILHAIIGQRVWLVFGLMQSVFLLNLRAVRTPKKRTGSSAIKRLAKRFSLIIIIISSVLLMQYSLSAREDKDFEMDGLAFLVKFLIGQTGTFTAFGLAIENHDFAFGSIIPPIFDPLNISREATQGAVTQTTTSLGSRITYLSCTSCYESGRSYGTSAFIQLYQWYALGIVFGLFMVGMFVKLIFVKHQYRPISIIVGFFLIRHFVWLPRGDVFPHYYTLLTIFISTLMFLIMIELSKFLKFHHRKTPDLMLGS